MGIATATVSPSNLPQQIDKSDPQGAVYGNSPTDKIGFFGTTAAVQPGGGGSLAGITGLATLYSTTQSPTAVTPNTSAEKSMTVSGVAATDIVAVLKPTAQAGLIVGSARVSASNTVQVTLGNDTAATITPTASETYNVLAIAAAFGLSAALSPAAVGPNTTAEQQFTVLGVPASGFLIVNKPTAQAGLIIVGARIVAAGVVGITFGNLTAATITPTASESYAFFASAGLAPAPVAREFTAALAPASVAANTSAEQTFTVPGLVSGNAVFVNKPSTQLGLGIGGARVSAANTLAITFVNDTGSAIVPNAEVYSLFYLPQVPAAAGSSNASEAAQGSGDHNALVTLGLTAGP